METNVNYTIVGAFVISLATVIILGIIWLSSGFSVETYSTYLVYMQESVSGLSIDAPVEYNGVKVGAVKSINLNQHNPHLVELQLNIKTGTPITEGTVATLDSKGITGITFIALKDKSTNLTPLKALPGQDYPVIKTAPSFFLRIDLALEKLNKSLSQVSTSIQSLLDSENLHSIKQTLSNLDRITANLAAQNQRLTSIMANTAQASNDFPIAMQVLSTQTLPSMNNLISNMDSFTKEIKDNPSILIRGTAQPQLGPGEN